MELPQFKGVPTPVNRPSPRYSWPALLASCLLASATALAHPVLGQAQTPTVQQDLEVGFRPIEADPRSRSTYLSVLDWDAPWLATSVAAVGVGDGLTLYRDRGGSVWVDVGADFVIHAQFDLDRPSFDFINADFVVSAPVTLRRGSWSARARLGHWSAHLGDEFLLRTEIERLETSVEFLEGLLARDIGPVRALVGVERRLRIVPRTLPRNLLRWGADTRNLSPFDAAGLGTAAVTAGIDARWDRSTHGPAVSAFAGIDITPDGPNRRTWGLQFEFFDGRSPFGQFFDQPLRTWGVSFRLR